VFFSFTYVPAPGDPFHVLYRLHLSTSSLPTSGFHLADLPSLFIGDALDHDAMHCIHTLLHCIVLYDSCCLSCLRCLSLMVCVLVANSLSDTTST